MLGSISTGALAGVFVRSSRLTGGFSLVETVLAYFLLAGAIYLIVGLFHGGLRAHSRSQRLTEAARVAESTLARVRAWASDPIHFSSPWSGYNGVTFADPDLPGYQVRVDCRPPSPDSLDLFSPCRSLEASYLALGIDRCMKASVVPVRIQVSWGRSYQDQVTVWTHIAEPERALAASPTLVGGELTIPPGPAPHPLVVRRVGGPPDPVPRNGEVEFEAQLNDARGIPIRDVMFEWYVVPVTGNATLVDSQLDPAQPRSGTTRRVRHCYAQNPSTGAWRYAPGAIRLRARARYHGVEVLQLSEEVVLGP